MKARALKHKTEEGIWGAFEDNWGIDILTKFTFPDFFSQSITIGQLKTACRNKLEEDLLDQFDLVDLEITEIKNS